MATIAPRARGPTLTLLSTLLILGISSLGYVGTSTADSIWTSGVVLNTDCSVYEGGNYQVVLCPVEKEPAGPTFLASRHLLWDGLSPVLNDLPIYAGARRLGQQVPGPEVPQGASPRLSV